MMHENQSDALGVVSHDSARRNDFLYRLSLKCLVVNTKGEVLVVKETGRDYWDLPGGGMDHGESIALAIAREMNEEVKLEGGFAYDIIAVEEPAMLPQNFWQVRLIFEVKPHRMIFSSGDDCDAVMFMNPQVFEHSQNMTERLLYKYYMKRR